MCFLASLSPRAGLRSEWFKLYPFKPPEGNFDTQNYISDGELFKYNSRPLIQIQKLLWHLRGSFLDNSWVKKWTVRGSVSHIDAKYRSMKKGYQTAVMSVLLENDWSLRSALMVEYFGIWSSVYWQLLQYFILFCYVYSKKPLCSYLKV